MTYKQINETDSNSLIDNTYQMKITDEDLPYEDIVIPVGKSVLNFTCSKGDITLEHYENLIRYKEAYMFGQFFGHYKISTNEECSNFGITFKPTALYKLFRKNFEDIKNDAEPLESFDKDFYDKIIDVFRNYNDDLKAFTARVKSIINSITVQVDENTKWIDKTIKIIEEKKGLLKVTDLLEEVPFSQKSLESYFKKIIGLTPNQYIRQYRFVNLIRDYKSGLIDIKSLVETYNYYDTSHFTKDLLFFTGQNPKTFFKSDHPLIESYLT